MMKEPNRTSDSFRFKQFTVYQNKTAMKVGTDGVLLGAWADISNTSNILDVGTGTGLIALMLAQRSTARISAVEIDEDATNQARENFVKSPWNQRIELFYQSFSDFANQSVQKFDLIVSNPPYFSNSLKNPDSKRTLARHNDSLNLKDLLATAREICNSDGKICLILPVDSEKELYQVAENCQLYINEKVYVKPSPAKNPKRILIKVSQTKAVTQISEMNIETDVRHYYSDEYIDLTKDFYLKM
jgi:tRNA1Val (adenine37-N6)-methyltransferase